MSTSLAGTPVFDAIEVSNAIAKLKNHKAAAPSLFGP
jgi:hypothetical protein